MNLCRRSTSSCARKCRSSSSGCSMRPALPFVFVTHDQEEALTMSDRVAVMSEGQILQIGSPREIYDHPSERFVANFIGETNFLEAEYLGSKNGKAQVQTGFRQGANRKPAGRTGPAGAGQHRGHSARACRYRAHKGADRADRHAREHRLFRHRHALPPAPRRWWGVHRAPAKHSATTRRTMRKAIRFLSRSAIMPFRY